jgi:hypothetical protein
LCDAVSVASILIVVACGGADHSDLLDPRASEAGSASAAMDAAGAVGATTDTGVKCGMSGVCSVPTEVCCRPNRNGGPASDGCTKAGACAGLEIPCDDAADCAAAGQPGFVCCLAADSLGRAASIQCTEPGSCGGILVSGAPLCDRAVGGSCPDGTSCLPSQQTLRGYDICR